MQLSIKYLILIVICILFVGGCDEQFKQKVADNQHEFDVLDLLSPDANDTPIVAQAKADRYNSFLLGQLEKMQVQLSASQKSREFDFWGKYQVLLVFGIVIGGIIIAAGAIKRGLALALGCAAGLGTIQVLRIQLPDYVGVILGCVIIAVACYCGYVVFLKEKENKVKDVKIEMAKNTLKVLENNNPESPTETKKLIQNTAKLLELKKVTV